MGTLVFQANLGGAINLIGPNTASTVNFTLPSADGTANQALVTNGSGTLSFATVTTAAAGSNTQVQFNSSGAFAGSSNFTWDGSNLQIGSQGDLRLGDSDNSNWVAFQAPATVASNVTWTLPSADGTSGQALTTNGTGTLSWATIAASAATPTTLGTVFGKTDSANSIAFFGNGAGNASTTAAHNTALGNNAMNAITSGTRNIVVGSGAAAALTTGEGNIVLGTFGVGSGTNTFSANTSGSNNIAIGGQALRSSTTVSSNIAIGASALTLNTSGTPNLAIGVSSLQANTTGNNNVALGDNTLRSNTTGSNNTALGYQAGYTNSTGSDNTVIGYQAMYSSGSPSRNVCIGLQAGYSIINATENTCVGHKAGQYVVALTSGTNNVLIGNNTRTNAGTDNNSIVVSGDGQGKGSNTGFINPGAGGVYQGNNSSTWSTTSDRRLKKNIVDNNVGLEKLIQIQVRNFEYRLPEEVDPELKPSDAIQKNGVQLGVIAQELQQVLPDCVKQETSGVMSVDPDNLTWYTINAIKQLKAELDAAKAEIATLKGK
jgi:hypothetical protein